MSCESPILPVSKRFGQICCACIYKMLSRSVNRPTAGTGTESRGPTVSLPRLGDSRATEPCFSVDLSRGGAHSRPSPRTCRLEDTCQDSSGASERDCQSMDASAGQQ